VWSWGFDRQLSRERLLHSCLGNTPPAVIGMPSAQSCGFKGVAVCLGHRNDIGWR